MGREHARVQFRELIQNGVRCGCVRHAVTCGGSVLRGQNRLLRVRRLRRGDDHGIDVRPSEERFDRRRGIHAVIAGQTRGARTAGNRT